MPECMERKFILGVDIGGTKIAAAIATICGEIVVRRRNPTQAQSGTDAVIHNILATMEETIASAKINPSQLLGIGIAVAGIVDGDNGKVIFSPNLPDWHEIPLENIVQQRFRVPVYMGNDASIAALGEWHFGLKRGVSNLIYVTISTGIGGGIIASGKLYTGACGAAGEIGHMIIDVNGPLCSCGNGGCWEALASGTALAREAAKQIAEGAETSIAELTGGDISKIDARIVFLAAKQGDELAKELISRLGYYFGIGLVNLVNIFNPELILLGGGVAKMGNLLFQPAIKVVRERAFSALANTVEIQPAILGDDSGVLGAVAFVLEHSA